MGDNTLPKFSGGQVWAFETPADQPDAKVTVLRVEDGGPALGTIVHIAVSPVTLAGRGTTIGHLPFTESAMEQSVTELESESQPIEESALEGYRGWRQAFDAGEAGVFTLSVAEAVGAVLTTVRDGQPQD